MQVRIGAGRWLLLLLLHESYQTLALVKGEGDTP
jgi:hypothetical protein